MNSKTIGFFAILMLVLSSMPPIILNMQSVFAVGPYGKSIVIDDSINRVNATLGVKSGSVITAKGTITNIGPNVLTNLLTGVYFIEAPGVAIPADFSFEFSFDGIAWIPILADTYVALPAAAPYQVEQPIGAWGGETLNPGQIKTMYLRITFNTDLSPIKDIWTPDLVIQSMNVWVYQDLNGNRQFDGAGAGEFIFSQPPYRGGHPTALWDSPVKIDLEIVHTAEIDGTGKFYYTIQGAINAANPGDTIWVYPGTYAESISINKALTLTGDPGSSAAGPGPNAPILDGSTFANIQAVTITQGTSNVVFEGFEIKNYGPVGNTNADGISVWNSGTFNVRISDNYMHNLGYAGILTGNGWGGPQGLHSGWTIAQNKIEDFGAYAIDLENTKDSQIINNEIMNPKGPNYGINVISLAFGTNTIDVSNVNVTGNQIINYTGCAVNLFAWTSDLYVSGDGAGASATVRKIIVSGNTITGNTTSLLAWATGPGTEVLRDLTIDGNSFKVNNPSAANYIVNLADAAGSNEFTNNLLNLTGVIGGGGTFFHGVNIGGSQTGTWSMVNNVLDGNNVGASSVGFRLRGTLPATANLAFYGNTVTDFARGFSSDALLVGTMVTVNYNNIAGNSGYGIINAGTTIIDARYNWWGHASGPTHLSNSGGTGDAISNNIDYSPWLGFVVGTTPMTYHVNPTGLPGAIQEAVNEANAGDTVVVHEGTYPEQVLINKDLTLKGLSGAKITAPDARNTYTIAESTRTWDPLIFTYGGTMIGNAVSGTGTINVTISGFEIDGLNKAAPSPKRFVAVLCRNVKPCLVNSTYIHQMFDSDGQGNGPETFGIMCFGDSLATIIDNEVRDFSRGGIGITGDNGPLTDPTAHVQGNIVAGNGLETGTGWWAENGIQISYGAGGNITENEVSNCQVNNPSWASTGIIVYDAANGVRILTNSIEDCDVGITVSSPSYDIIDGNSVIGCNWEGIRLGWPVNHCTVTNNTVTNSWAGIGIWDASENTISRNTLENNEYGIYMDGDSDNNIITRNHILSNIIDGLHAEPYDGNDPSGTQVHYNCIVGNGDYGVYKDGAETINATHNWWGDSLGPYHSTKNPDGMGDEVSDNVLFDPWLRAYFDYYRKNPVVDEPVTFDASLSTKPCNTRTITSYTWNFDDGNTTIMTDPTIVHAFGTLGSYNVTLTLTYDDTSTATEWGIVQVSARPFFKVEPQLVEIHLRDRTFDVNITLNDLSAIQRGVAVEFRIQYNSTLLEYINVTEGAFLKQFNQTSIPPYTFFVSFNETNHALYGSNIIVGILIYPNSTGGYPGPFPQGSGTLATITFKAKYQEKGYDILQGGYFKPPLTCNLTLIETSIVNPELEHVPHDTLSGQYKIWPNNVGDLNWDGKVRVDDVLIAAQAFGSNSGGPRWNPEADINGDGKVRVDDIYIIARNFGWTADNP